MSWSLKSIGLNVEFVLLSTAVESVVVVFLVFFSTMASSTCVFMYISRGGASCCASTFGDIFWILMFWPDPYAVFAGSLTSAFFWKPLEMRLETARIFSFW